MLAKGVPDPRATVWTGLKISNDMRALSQDNSTGMRLSIVTGVCPLGYSGKICIHSSFLRSCKKTGGGGGKRSHFHVTNSLLLLPFPWLHYKSRLCPISLFVYFSKQAEILAAIKLMWTCNTVPTNTLQTYIHTYFIRFSEKKKGLFKTYYNRVKIKYSNT